MRVGCRVAQVGRVRVGIGVGWGGGGGGGGGWCVRRVGNIVVSFYLKIHGGIFTFFIFL